MALHLPERYEGLREENAGIRMFEGRDLEASDRIARHIRRGGLAVLKGEWEALAGLYKALKKRGALPSDLRRLMVEAEGDQLYDVAPPLRIPHLAQVLGERVTPSSGQAYLAALEDVERALAAMERFHPVTALGGDLIVHENVLVPRSQPLIHLLRTAMERMTPDLSDRPNILDMGCGSGCCALLAAQVWPQATVVATDHLPEAAATTRINAARFEGLGRIRPGAVVVAEPGDLFETIGDARFDLMIFNAPWVAAPARNRMETALNDGGQQTVMRFLHGAAERLTPGGRVLLGYADHSGPNAIARLERFIAEAGLTVLHKHTDRIKTHRSKRAWESIIAYDLGLAESR